MMTDAQFSQLLFFLSVSAGIGGGFLMGVGCIVFGVMTMCDKSDKTNTFSGLFAMFFGFMAIGIAVFSFIHFRGLLLRGIV